MNLEELTVKELQMKLVEMGMPEDVANALKTKAPLIKSVEMMQDKPVEEEKVKSIQEPIKPSEEKRVNTRWLSKAKIMKRKLLEQHTVSILVPLEAHEKMGVVQWADKKGEIIPDGVWNKLSVDEKMETHQVAVSGATDNVQINGFKWFMPKGIYTPVPFQVADEMAISQQQTLNAGAEIKLDRIDPKTGKPFSEVL